jgi:hypothetical protein
MQEKKPFSWAKPAYVDFSSSDFNVHGHMLSTGEDALSKEPIFSNFAAKYRQMFPCNEEYKYFLFQGF